jgi:hypothetical protein
MGNGEAKADFIEYLTNSGCMDNNPDPVYWGTDSDKILVSAGQFVAQGQAIANAGETGPGGKRGGPGVNTHLHIFFARKDTDNKYYFIDPYGVYAYTGCYPSNVLGPLTGCSRYPVAWDTTGGLLHRSA